MLWSNVLWIKLAFLRTVFIFWKFASFVFSALHSHWRMEPQVHSLRGGWRLRQPGGHDQRAPEAHDLNCPDCRENICLTRGSYVLCVLFCRYDLMLMYKCSYFIPVLVELEGWGCDLREDKRKVGCYRLVKMFPVFQCLCLIACMHVLQLCLMINESMNQLIVPFCVALNHDWVYKLYFHMLYISD